MKLDLETYPDKVNRYVGELSLVRIPHRKFSLDTWSSFEKYDAFCADTIQRVIENLLLVRILEGHVQKSDRSVLGIFRYTKTTYWLSLNEKEYAEYTHFGFLERSILRAVNDNPDGPIKIQLRDFLEALVGEQSVTSPAKIVLGKVIEKNALQAWEAVTTSNWFVERIEIIISEDAEDIFDAAFIEVEAQREKERVLNEAFHDFSRKLKRAIQWEMLRKRDSS